MGCCNTREFIREGFIENKCNFGCGCGRERFGGFDFDGGCCRQRRGRGICGGFFGGGFGCGCHKKRVCCEKERIVERERGCCL